jgi:hypothetical protein
MLDDKHENAKPVIDEPPPFLGTWPRVYIMVIGYLAVLIGLFFAFTKAFAP